MSDLDETDLRILKKLQKDGRMNCAEILEGQESLRQQFAASSQS